MLEVVVWTFYVCLSYFSLSLSEQPQRAIRCISIATLSQCSAYFPTHIKQKSQLASIMLRRPIFRVLGFSELLVSSCLLRSDAGEIVDTGGDGCRSNFSALDEGLRKARNLAVVHFPFGNLPRSREFWLFLHRKSDQERGLILDHHNMTHCEWVLTKIDRFRSVEAVFAACIQTVRKRDRTIYKDTYTKSRT